MSTPITAENPLEQTAEDIWNFAIGSNMHPNKMSGVYPKENGQRLVDR